MIMMHEPNSNLSRSTSNGECGDDGPSCTCLKIQPQSDCNLAEVHPNIYIPSGLLDYPERIVKYGGGGSGVTGESLFSSLNKVMGFRFSILFAHIIM